MADFFKTGILGLIMCLMFFTIFGRPQSLADYIKQPDQIQTDPNKEPFMEDCLAVVMNTKTDCEIIYKDLAK